MNWQWFSLRPHDGWTVLTERPLQTVEVGIMTHLYQPIIGGEAVSLYITLSLQADYHTAGESPVHTHRYLMGLVCLPLDRLLEARHRLEAVGLLKVFHHREDLGNLYVYNVIPPLTPESFFKTDVLAVTLLNRLGKESFRQVKERFLPVATGEPREKRRTLGKEITKKFHEVFTSITPSELTVHEASEVKHMLAPFETVSPIEQATGPDFSGVTLDWAFLRAQAAPVGSIDHLTKEERAKIEEIAFFYRLGDGELGKAMQNPEVYDEKNELQVEKLQSYIKREYRYRFGRLPDLRPVSHASTSETDEDSRVSNEGEDLAEVHRKWLANMSPLELLERYHRGGKVPQTDVELVEMLREQYGLPNGVINVLIEYVLLTNDYKLPRPLVEKVAGHWRRANVKTVEEAQALALKQLERPRDKLTAHKRGLSKGTKAKRRVEKKQPERPVTDEERKDWQRQFNQLLKKLREKEARDRKP